MIYELRFEISGLPDTPNTLLGKGWRARVGHANKWHRLVWRHCWHLKPGAPLAHARVSMTRCSSHRGDFDGLAGSFKHVLDGLVKAGIIQDDKPEVIGTPTYLWEKAAPRKGKIIVKVEGV